MADKFNEYFIFVADNLVSFLPLCDDVTFLGNASLSTVFLRPVTGREMDSVLRTLRRLVNIWNTAFLWIIYNLDGVLCKKLSTCVWQNKST